MGPRSYLDAAAVRSTTRVPTVSFMHADLASYLPHASMRKAALSVLALVLICEQAGTGIFQSCGTSKVVVLRTDN